MLVAAEDEDHDAEDDTQIFAHLMLIGHMDLHAHVDHDVAEHTQHKQRQQGVVRFDLADGHGFLRQSGAHAGHLQQRCHQLRTQQVTHPHQTQKRHIPQVLARQIAGFSGKQVQFQSAYHEQTNREKQGAQHLALQRQEYCSAKGNGGARQNRQQKIIHFSHETPSFRTLRQSLLKKL